MYTCSNCGTEFDSKYLQCPNCGCARGDIKNAALHDKRTERIGGIIAIVFIVFLIGLVSYGTYLLLNPFKEGPTISNLPSTTTVTPVDSSTTSISKTTKTTTTTTAVIGVEVPLGAHTITIPEGFSQASGQLDFIPLTMYDHTQNGIWILNNATNSLMYFSIADSVNMKKEEEVSDRRKVELTKQGFTDIEADRISGKLVYFALKDLANGYYEVILYYNKNSNLVLSTFTIEDKKLNADNIKDVLTIISTIK